jgi:nucleoside-diphosphate-sugar epimerase
MIITGASGFIGRHLVDEFKSDFRLFALARRSQHDCSAPVHPNIAWMQVDIGDRESLARTFREIATAGGAHYLLHLAAHYDFTGQKHPEYQRTNVTGTRNILDLARDLELKRIVFASSVAASAFPPLGSALTEQTPLDGDHVYAWSKRQGEAMIREFSQVIPTCTVRFGAVYSDWCEYVPLYVFLETWLGKSWRSRILAGKGESAIPYIHIREVAAFFCKLLSMEPTLERHEVFIASTDGSTSHKVLFDQASRSFFGRPRRAMCLPIPLARMGLSLLNLVGAAAGRQPFERTWMMRYVDRQLTIDASQTASRLGWQRDPRLRLERRLPFLIERMKSEPLQWHNRNLAILRRTSGRPDLHILNALMQLEAEIVSVVVTEIKLPTNRVCFPRLSAMEDTELSWHTKLVLRLLYTSVQRSNRLLILDYFELSAVNRFEAGFTGDELCAFLQILGETVLSRLRVHPELASYAQEINDRITLPIEIGKDEIQVQYAHYLRGVRAESRMPRTPAATDRTARQQLEETIWDCLVNRR